MDLRYLHSRKSQLVDKRREGGHVVFEFPASENGKLLLLFSEIGKNWQWEEGPGGKSTFISEVLNLINL